MPWDNARPGTDPKYAKREHRELRGHWVRAILAGEVVECRAVECLLPHRRILNVDGRQRDGLNLGHEDDGIRYRGPEHRVCNLHDAAVRARAKQNAAASGWVF